MNWTELHNLNGSIASLLINVSIILVISNILFFMLDILFNKYFDWYDKREKEKYNFYDWIGKPDSPLDLQSIYENKKDFARDDFIGNCKLIKDTISDKMNSLEKLQGYRRFLELQTSSPRLNTLMNASQTILIAVITAALITFLNFNDVSVLMLIVSYFVAMIFVVGLLKAIDFYSSKIDRNKLLLVLVNECIEEYDSSKMYVEIQNLHPNKV